MNDPLTVIVRRFSRGHSGVYTPKIHFARQKDQALIALHHVLIFTRFPPFRAAAQGSSGVGDDGDGVGVHGDGVPAVVQVVATS